MKKTLTTVAIVVFMASPSLFAAQDSLQEHLQMEQKIQKQEQLRLKDGSGSGTKNQYKHQNQYQNQHQYNTGGANKSGMGSSMRQGGGGKR